MDPRVNWAQVGEILGVSAVSVGHDPETDGVAAKDGLG